ncbi:MAG: OmpH family outer membrane protein [Gammaproteobacteria bacterium]
MRRVQRVAVAAIFALSTWPGFLLAQGVGDLKIGVVNAGRLLNESPQVRIAMETLQDEFAPRQREIIAQQTAYQEKQAQLKRDLEVMGAEERRNAERDLRNEERSMARRQQEFSEDFELRRNEELAKVQQDLLRDIQAFGQLGNYDLILGDGVLYATPVVDVTEDVLNSMQAAAPSQGGQ